jgi:hypothetical protein
MGFVTVRKKGKDIITTFSYAPHTNPFLIFYSSKIPEFLERLKPDLTEFGYGLTYEQWAKAIIFASAAKFLRDRRILREFEDFLLSIDPIDLNYWYYYVRGYAESPRDRDRIIKAMLTLFGFRD